MIVRREFYYHWLGVQVDFHDEAAYRIVSVHKFYRGTCGTPWNRAAIHDLGNSPGELRRLAELEAKALEHCYPTGTRKPYHASTEP